MNTSTVVDGNVRPHEKASEVAPEQACDGRLQVYFDGSCPLCTFEITHYSRQVGSEQLSFVDVSGANPQTGADLEASEALSRFHVRLPGGQLVSGARAFVAIWRELPTWRWVARIASLPGVTPMLELSYRAFLPIRPLLSKIAGRFGASAARTSDGGSV